MVIEVSALNSEDMAHNEDPVDMISKQLFPRLRDAQVEFSVPETVARMVGALRNGEVVSDDLVEEGKFQALVSWASS